MVDFKSLYEEQGDPVTFEPLPVGNYLVEITKSEATIASTGKPMIKVTCRIVDGPYAQRIVWHNFVISPENKNALQIFFRGMNAFGLGREYMMQGPTEAQVANTLVGRMAMASVGQRTYNGEIKNEVKNFRRPPTNATYAGLSSGPGPVPPPAAAAPAPAAPPPVAQMPVQATATMSAAPPAPDAPPF